MGRLPKIQFHRNGLLMVAGIVPLVALVGGVWTVAILRSIAVLVVIAAIIVLRVQTRDFSSESTFNSIRKPRKQQ